MKFNSNTKTSRRFRAWRSLNSVLIVSALAVTLGACKHNDYKGEVAGWTLIDSSQRHPILVSQEPQTLDVAVSAGARGLGSRQRAKVINFAQRARASDAGNSKMVISVPTGGKNEISSMYAVQDIRRLLTGIGFQQSSISVEASYDQHGPIQLSYLRYVAEGPECGNWSQNLARDPQNIPHTNFGCAGQHNFAAMVANPADLLGPRTQTERYSDRRETTFNKYIGGEVTGADKSADERINTQEQE